MLYSSAAIEIHVVYVVYRWKILSCIDDNVVSVLLFVTSSLCRCPSKKWFAGASYSILRCTVVRHCGGHTLFLFHQNLGYCHKGDTIK